MEMNTRQFPARGNLCRSHLQGREAERAARRGPGKVRTGDQPQDRESPRPHRAADVARPRRRGDRMRAATSEFGTFLPFVASQHHGRYRGYRSHVTDGAGRPSLTQLRHSQASHVEYGWAQIDANDPDQKSRCGFQPCFAARFAGVSGGNATQGWRDSSHTAMVGAGNFGSAKLPMATATYPGKPLPSQ